MAGKKEKTELSQYRSFAIRQGRLLGEPDYIRSAIADFASLELLATRPGIAPGFREIRTQDIIYRLVLTTEEADHARKLGLDAYSAFRAVRGEATADEIKAFSPEAKWMYEEDPEQKKRERRQVEQQTGRRKLREKIEGSYKALMNLTDDQLRTQNSNLRVDFEGDSVFQTTYSNRKAAFKRRSLTVRQYQAIGGQVSEAEDIIQIRRARLGGSDLIAYAAGSLETNRVLKEGLGNERFVEFNNLVLALLTGEALSSSQIRSLGFDPEEVLRTAMNRHANFGQLDMTEGVMLEGL